MTIRLVVRTFSELCVTAGALIVLFVVYILFWTGVRADSAMNGELDHLQNTWATGSLAPATPTPAPTATSTGAPAAPAAPPPYKDGESFAVMYIPRLGADWHKPVLQGTGTGVLKKGLGHYANTTRPGGTGNFSVAGHRRTYGDPFKDFPGLRRGDRVYLFDGASWYTYVLDRDPYRTVPTDVGVIDPVPRESGYTVAGRYLTLTTCDPEWGHSHRLIAWAHLEAVSPGERGKPKGLTG
ncbi:class E sortase [Streptomyces sp. H10-C2]|uniref:class E sortase n=1 Tax=unclassified Streptomyces TaxID=2593676 RepID=UPI0024BB50CF|nr:MULTISPECIES: class E sortase [unclassified Streptomyces]MDJ0340242.1 class E sortase [Streptomyces sp. PH10-H1]MDJ0368309.1 class E sortase [Streptomyces sp. H10-C2]